MESSQVGFSTHSEAQLEQDAEEIRVGKEDNNCILVAASMDSSCMTGCTVEPPNFRVDDLLNFPSELEDELLADSSPGLFMNAPAHDTAHVKFEGSSSAVDEPSYGLCIPPDELVHQLEWLSSLNEDCCFIGGDIKAPLSASSSSRTSSGLAWCIKEAPMTTSRKPRESFNSQSPVSVLEQGTHSYRRLCGINHVYKSHRVRKARTGGRVWSLDILKPIRVDNRIKNSYESTSLLVTLSSSVYSEPLCSFLRPDDLERSSKKMKQASGDVDLGLVRRCTHCLVQKTPQWRAGPHGPKTLCNACGVRYKSGRLVPEYRPAASPSFVNEIHSNSHRRILEMRRAKEVELCVEIHRNKVKRGEETDGSENEGGSYESSQGNCEESLGMHACKGQLSSEEPKKALPCKQVEVSGDDRSCTDGASEQDAPRKASGSWREGTTATDDLIGPLTSKESSVSVNTSVYNIEAMRQGKSMVGIHEQGTITSPAEGEPG